MNAITRRTPIALTVALLVAAQACSDDGGTSSGASPATASSSAASASSDRSTATGSAAPEDAAEFCEASTAWSDRTDVEEFFTAIEDPATAKAYYEAQLVDVLDVMESEAPAAVAEDVKRIVDAYRAFGASGDSRDLGIDFRGAVQPSSDFTTSLVTCSRSSCAPSTTPTRAHRRRSALAA